MTPVEICEKIGDSYYELVSYDRGKFDPYQFVRKLLSAGKFQEYEGEARQLELFIKNLRDVKLRRPDVFVELSKKIGLSATKDNYYGLRMEARIASSLARRSVEFEYSDKPDFWINHRSLAIECGSVWPNTKDPKKDYRLRLSSTIKSKGGKRYANKKTILALEITSVAAAMQQHGHIGERSDLDAFLFSAISASGFGAVVCFTLVYSRENNLVQWAYRRLDSQKIDDSLKLFLNEHFPKGHFEVLNPYVPGDQKPITIYKAKYRFDN